MTAVTVDASVINFGTAAEMETALGAVANNDDNVAFIRKGNKVMIVAYRNG